jgi:putative (di)nucleoside polyphosphate hydrolase
VLDSGISINACDYRPCVGVVLINSNHQVFVAKRLDGERLGWPNSWQFPQGGIDEAEDPKTAALRELKEETGITTVEILDENPDWIYYDLPNDLAARSWGGRFKGQRQKWFLMNFLGSNAEINLNQTTPEFCAWEWIPFNESINRVVPFKIDVYKQVISYFSTWFK